MADAPTSPSSPAPAPSAPAAPAPSATTPSPSSAQPTSTPAQAPAPAAAPAAAARPDRPAYIPEAHWDAQGGKAKDTFTQYVGDLEAFRAAEQVKANARPQAPDGYKPETSKDFVIPQGSEYRFNDKDPRIPKVQAWAHKYGLTQDAFSELMDLGASADVERLQGIATARDAEVGKLGANAAARMSAISTFLGGTLGEAAAKPLQNSIWTADAVKAWETLISKFTSGHGSRFAQNGRDTTTRQVDQATYDKWSTGQRLNYARTGDPDRAM